MDLDLQAVHELTGLLRRSLGGDRLANWPADMRIICRPERPSSGAQLSLMQTNRLRALLLGGDDTDRQVARNTLADATLAALARRRPPRDSDRHDAVRHAEIRRLALALRLPSHNHKIKNGNEDHDSQVGARPCNPGE